MEAYQDIVASALLEKLNEKIAFLVNKQISSAKVSNEWHELFAWEISGFNYSTEGVFIKGATRVITKYRNWTKISRLMSSEIFNLAEFKEAEEYFLQKYGEQYAILSLESLVYKILPVHFSQEKHLEPILLQDLCKRYVDSMAKAPIKSKATVFLIGIILESTIVQIEPSIILRQTNQADLEEPTNYDEQIFNIMPFHTAVLEIEMELENRNGILLQEKIEQYIAILRLFGLGSVQYKSYRISQDILAPMSPGGTTTPIGSRLNVWKNFILKKSEEQQFRYFIDNLKLPTNLYAFEKKPNHITTAFDRYNEAILENVTIERRIANAIMGIEALLSNDNMELSFKLQTRVSKLLSAIGMSSIPIKGNLNKAYSVMSNFAHGGYLTDKERLKLETAFGSINDFAVTIISYLRITLIISLAIDMLKDELIKLIDDAMIDDSRALELKDSLMYVKQFIIN